MCLKTSDYKNNMLQQQPQARLYNGLAIEWEYKKL
jgi:hypothetical protein